MSLLALFESDREVLERTGLLIGAFLERC